MSSERKHLPMYTIDAFASKPFKGNPAAVCLLQDEDLSDETKQNIAMEMNLSETAFVRPVNAGSRFGLRWFTPKNEVNLCGHATLASAAALFTCKGNYDTSVNLIPYGVDKLIEVWLCDNFPSNQFCIGFCESKQFELNEESSLNVKISLGSCQPVDVQYTPGANRELLLRLPDTCSRQEFEQMSPNPSAMMNAYKTGEVMGVILTLKGSKENGAVDEDGRMFDFISRYFAPWNGIDEDPVTGAAHTVLSAYWSKVLRKTEMYARQCSKRGGNIEIKVRDDGRVELAGKARTVLEGKIFVD
ncbi:Phenazine biosynthesis-like domain-containing protein [Holothuria leucospilota]|uniref:Phenazine biosynthesis-like domain-containing protein n=1 Tax=Holothuria leucospilota TaxID=206669 RepID=A0A9Q0YHC5_HOLLE|nr:Phenazine biosynthesis-like domain-containing protein [Holothuria leucospilota]